MGANIRLGLQGRLAKEGGQALRAEVVVDAGSALRSMAGGFGSGQSLDTVHAS